MKTKMKKISNRLVVALIGAVILAAVTSSKAQGTTNSLSSWLDLSATNWVVIPYASYDFTTHKIGGGAAALYQVSPVFWAGLRGGVVDGQFDEAGVQGQLQVTTHVLGFTATPFLETTVGIGKSALYGSAGPGMLVNLYSHSWGTKTLNIGLVADYEHYVLGGKNGNVGNIGPSLNFSF